MQTINEINKLIQLNGEILIFDNNEKWHHSNGQLISEYIDGDIHTLFDHLLDENLFSQIDNKFDSIFIGELFHVLEYHTLIYNLEQLYKVANNNAFIYISIPVSSNLKIKASNSKIITRIMQIDSLEIVDKQTYEDEELWTLLKLQYKPAAGINDTEMLVQIGELLVEQLATGKKISKIKKNNIITKLNITTEVYNKLVPSTEDAIKFAILNDILKIKYTSYEMYCKMMGEYIYKNRLAIKHLDQKVNTQIKNSIFEFIASKFLMPSDKQLSEIALNIEYIWETCINKRLK